MKKIATLIAIVIIVLASCATFAQSQKVAVRRGDSITVVVTGQPQNVVQPRSVRPTHRRLPSATRSVQPIIIKNYLPPVINQPVSDETPNQKIVENDRYWKGLIFGSIIPIAALSIILAVLLTNLYHRSNYSSSGKQDTPTVVNHIYGSRNYGGQGGSSRNDLYAGKHSHNDSSKNRFKSRHESSYTETRNTSINREAESPKNTEAPSKPEAAQPA